MKHLAFALTIPLALVFGCAGSDDNAEKAQLQVDGESVECRVGSGSGNAPAPGEEDAELHCEYEFSECNNGHTYQIDCTSQQGSGKGSCTCYVDAEPQSDDPIEVNDECPVQEEVILEACGW